MLHSLVSHEWFINSVVRNISLKRTFHFTEEHMNERVFDKESAIYQHWQICQSYHVICYKKVFTSNTLDIE